MRGRVLLVSMPGRLSALGDHLRAAGKEVFTADLSEKALREYLTVELDLLLVELSGDAVSLCRSFVMARVSVWTGAAYLVYGHEDDLYEHISLEALVDGALWLGSGYEKLANQFERYVSARGSDKNLLKIQYGSNIIDLEQQVVWGSKELLVELSLEETTFLQELAYNIGAPVSRDALAHTMALVSGNLLSSRALDSKVHRLRRRLKSAGVTEEVLITVHGYGYKLLPEIRN